MELQTAKYYQESESAPVEFTTFANPGDDRPKPPTHAEERSSLVAYAALVLLVLGWFASMYAVSQIFRIEVPTRGSAKVIHHCMGLVLADYCKTPDHRWLTFGITSAMVIVALVTIGCVPRNKSTSKACKDNHLANIALSVGEQLRGQGSHAFAIATAYMLVGTLAAFIGITWMVTLYEEHEKGAFSVFVMTVVSQVGIAAGIGGAICLFRQPAENASLPPQPDDTPVIATQANPVA